MIVAPLFEPSSASFRQVVTRRLAEDPFLASRIFETVQEKVPAYRMIQDDKVLSEIRDGIENITKAYLSALAEQRGFTGTEKDLIVGIGTRRASQGYSLDDLIAGMRTAVNEGVVTAVREAVARSDHDSEVQGDHYVEALVADLLHLRDETETALRIGYALSDSYPARQQSGQEHQPILKALPREQRQQFVDETLGPLLHDKECFQLLKAIRALSAYRFKADAAKSLYVDRRTLHRYQKRIETLLNLEDQLDPNLPKLVLAIEMLDMLNREGDESDLSQ